MTARLFLILRVSIIMAVIALAVIGSIYVLDIVEDRTLHKALGKVLALLGIYTGCALAITILTASGGRLDRANEPADR